MAARPDPQRLPDGRVGERLQKVLAAAGLGSRRECEELILDGRVEVDRDVVGQLGTRVDPRRQEIRVDGVALQRPKLVYYALHKPPGVVCTARDPSGRPRAVDLVPDQPRVFAVGRLDMHSEGLLLLTNDGEMTNGLTHPRHEVEKTYRVLVAGSMTPEDLAKLRRGMRLAEGFARPKRLRIKGREKKNTWLEMVLDEGRNREIRRLLARLGHKVQRLRRIAIGSLRLGEVPAGAYRELRPEEVKALRKDIAESRHRNREAAKTARNVKRKKRRLKAELAAAAAPANSGRAAKHFSTTAKATKATRTKARPRKGRPR